jgi:hypothetical protein
MDHGFWRCARLGSGEAREQWPCSALLPCNRLAATEFGMVAMTSPSPPLENRSYGPDALGVLNQAFDSAWAEIAGNFADDALEVQSARNKLADALLRAADQQGCTDVEILKTAALRSMALSFARSRSF